MIAAIGIGITTAMTVLTATTATTATVLLMTVDIGKRAPLYF